MSLAHAIFFGIGVLIALYLGLSHGDAFVGVLNAGGSNLVSETKALQGR
jgi:hypothetical protein